MSGTSSAAAASSGAPSVSKAEKKTEESPKDVEAWRELSTALQTDGQTDKAIAAQEQVVVLAPKDADALRELAGLYLAQANAKQQEAQILQVQAAYAGAGYDFPGAFASPAGQSLVNDAISVAIAEQSSTKLQALVSAAQAASAAGVDAYRKVAVLSPGDPNVQLELAQTAQQAGDTATAIAAYKAFLKLAPDDANAPIVKQQLKQLAPATSG